MVEYSQSNLLLVQSCTSVWSHPGIVLQTDILQQSVCFARWLGNKFQTGQTDRELLLPCPVLLSVIQHHWCRFLWNWFSIPTPLGSSSVQFKLNSTICLWISSGENICKVYTISGMHTALVKWQWKTFSCRLHNLLNHWYFRQHFTDSIYNNR